MSKERFVPPKNDVCPVCKSDIVRQDSDRSNWACSNQKCGLAKPIQGKTDIEKAIHLLREIDAFLSFNIQPPKEQMSAIRKTIQEFTGHFPECWECGDTGFLDSETNVKCKCTFK